jgi:hypothetical protein
MGQLTIVVVNHLYYPSILWQVLLNKRSNAVVSRVLGLITLKSNKSD